MLFISSRDRFELDTNMTFIATSGEVQHWLFDTRVYYSKKETISHIKLTCNMNTLLIYLNVHTIFLPIFDWLLMHSRITFIRPRQAGICVSIIWIVIFIHASCLSSKNHGCEKKSQVGQRELVNETLDWKWIFRRLVIIQTSSYRFNQITIVMDDTSTVVVFK